MSNHMGFTNEETFLMADALEHTEEIQSVIDGCKTYSEAVDRLEAEGYDISGYGVRLRNVNLNVMQLDRVIRDITGI